MKYHKFIIEKDYNSIYYFLKDEGFSENFITNLRKDMGNFLLNETPVTIRTPLKSGDILKVNNNPNNKTTIMQCILPLDIVYEDKYYILINKPSGISCMPNKSHYTKNLAGGICYYMKEKDKNFVLRIINRLDKDTAGIIIVAKDSISQNKINDIDKTYFAICEGNIDKEIEINSRIKTITENGINEQKRIISDDGQEAITRIYPIKSNSHHSLIKIKLTHGRTHQIRVHLSSINHPLTGDEIYGEKSEFIDHTALICKEVNFYHYIKKKELKFEIDFSEDFKNLLAKFDLN